MNLLGSGDVEAGRGQCSALMSVELEVYRECFEDQFLDHTRKFYQDAGVLRVSFEVGSSIDLSWHKARLYPVMLYRTLLYSALLNYTVQYCTILHSTLLEPPPARRVSFRYCSRVWTPDRGSPSKLQLGEEGTHVESRKLF